MTVTTKNMFGVIDISDLNHTVGHPNGTMAKIKYVGNLKLSKDVVLYDVLVDLTQNKIMRTGSEYGGLYMFDQTSSHNIGKNMDIAAYVSKLYGTADLVTLLIRAKQTREPFPLSEHKTSVIGEIIHLILWGPYKVTSRLPSSVLNDRNDAGLNIPIFDVNIENTDEVQPTIATRKSSRQSKLPASSGNYWFSTSLIKYVEPRTFYEAVKDRNWVDAMNAEIEAL
ncbi:hypothetical protein Tco_1226456 [Tanacetum coccineum]